MAHGVEGRTPFLDRGIADFAFRLPDNLKVRDGLGKWLLRSWLSAKVPAAEALGRKKGFSVPVAEWLRRRGGTLGPLLARQPAIREICLPDAGERRLATHDGKREGFAAWSLLFYALWHRAHIAKQAPEEDVFQTLSA
jgi:asparagine synthase (glutamine-hydrolysing)